MNVKKQQGTALFSIEVGYIVATTRTCQAIWMRRILQDLKHKQMQPIKIYCDNKSIIDISKNPAYQGKTKHTETRYHFLREPVVKIEVELLHYSTEEQPADILTKALTEIKTQKFRSIIGVLPLA